MEQDIGRRYERAGRLGRWGPARRALATDGWRRERVVVALPACEQDREAFVQWRRALRHAVAPGLAAIYDAGFDGDTPFLVVRPVEGRTLADALAERTLRPDEARRVAADLMAAIDALHREGLVLGGVDPRSVSLQAGAAACLSPWGALTDEDRPGAGRGRAEDDRRSLDELLGSAAGGSLLAAMAPTIATPAPRRDAGARAAGPAPDAAPARWWRIAVVAAVVIAAVLALRAERASSAELVVDRDDAAPAAETEIDTVRTPCHC